MDCKLVEDLISEYIEGDVPQETQDQLSIHLEQCSDCRQLKEKVEEMLYAFPDLDEEVPFFLKNRLLYIPESQENQVVTERRFFFMKWVAAGIGTFVLFLNLFYFTNFYPPANRLLHSVVAEVKTFTVSTGAYLERIKESKAFSIFSIFKRKAGDDEPKDDNYNDDHRKRRRPVEKQLTETPGENPTPQDKKNGDKMKKELKNKKPNMQDGGQND